MKILIRTHKMWLVIAAMLAVSVTIVALAEPPARGAARGDDFTTFVDILKGRGLSVASAGIDAEGTGEIVLASASDGSRVAPDDPLNEADVLRQATIAKARGLDITKLRVLLMNTLREVIYAAEVPIDQVIEDSWRDAADLSEDAAESQLSQAAPAKLPLRAATLSAAEVFIDGDGVRTASAVITVSDIEQANDSLAEFVRGFVKEVRALNAGSKAQVAIIRIDVSDAQGTPLLRFVSDLERYEDHAYVAEGVGTDWMPHYPPAAE